MDDVKRKSSVDHLLKENAKKSRSEFARLITCLENLSNEFFYEIFDYLNGCEIHEAFSNLNYRFNQLLNSSALLLRIKYDYSTSGKIFRNNYKQIIPYKSDQIYSIDLRPQENIHIIPFFMINSSFNHLESFTLHKIEARILVPLLSHLTRLPRLLSLSIDAKRSLQFETLGRIYQLILTLPKLKYIKLDTDIYDDFVAIIPLSIATAKQFSSITYLYISHPCELIELFNLISYTPELCRLKLLHIRNYEKINKTRLPIKLSNLTYISIELCELKFNEFEMLIRTITFGSKVLYLSVKPKDIISFDAKRWENLIQQYLPQLKQFYLTYEDHSCKENVSQFNQFFSSFWIERQWILETIIKDGSITYAIRPYRNKWYEYTQSNIVNSCMQLTLTNSYPGKYFHLLKSHINHISTIEQIHHLEICEVYVSTLIQIIDLLPQLDSLKISFLLLKQSGLSINDTELINLISNKNQITKVNLAKISDMEEVCFFLEFCPHMIYLKVDSINNIDMKLFVRTILLKIPTKCNHQLQLLCFRVQAADDEMIKTLQTMIDFEKLLLNYTIKRMQDSVYLQWK